MHHGSYICRWVFEKTEVDINFAFGVVKNQCFHKNVLYGLEESLARTFSRTELATLLLPTAHAIGRCWKTFFQWHQRLELGWHVVLIRWSHMCKTLKPNFLVVRYLSGWWHPLATDILWSNSIWYFFMRLCEGKSSCQQTSYESVMETFAKIIVSRDWGRGWHLTGIKAHTLLLSLYLTLITMTFFFIFWVLCRNQILKFVLDHLHLIIIDIKKKIFQSEIDNDINSQYDKLL